jgi:hypothetical protein
VSKPVLGVFPAAAPYVTLLIEDACADVIREQTSTCALPAPEFVVAPVGPAEGSVPVEVELPAGFDAVEAGLAAAAVGVLDPLEHAAVKSDVPARQTASSRSRCLMIALPCQVTGGVPDLRRQSARRNVWVIPPQT